MTRKQRSKKLNCYMSPWVKWLNRWRLRRIIAALSTQVNQGNKPHVRNFARSLEATEMMARGMKVNAEVIVTISRGELDAFIRYMCSLHDEKLSRIMLARIGLATLITRDDKLLMQPAEEVIQDEMMRAKKTRASIVDNAGKQLRLDL